MSGDFTVKRYGTDSSGRGIWMTAFLHDWHERLCERLGWRPVIVQGCFMTRNGGGAKDSDGAHDLGGSLDYRTRDLTKDQIDDLVREARDLGGAAYRRDETAEHGDMEEHCHVTVGADHPLSPMAQLIWASYAGGGDALAAGTGRPAGAPDYEWRPSPLVLTPPEDDMNKAQMLEVLNSDEGQAAIAKAVWKHRIVTADAPTGRYADGIIQRLHNHWFPKK